MKKTDLARLMHKARILEQKDNYNNEMLVEVIQNAFSGLATSNPKLALRIIQEMQKQVPSIESGAKEQEANEAAFVAEMVPRMMDSLEFEREDEDEDYNGN